MRPNIDAWAARRKWDVITDHDPGDEDREEMPTLSVERVRELIDQATAGTRELHHPPEAARAIRHGGRPR